MIGPRGLRARGTMSWPDVRSFDRQFVREMAAANRKLSEAGALSARGEAPKLSGRLAASIRPHRGRWYKAEIKAGGKRLPYAGPIHYGWPKRNIEPNLFLERGAERIRNRAKKDYIRAVERAAQSAMARNLVEQVF